MELSEVLNQLRQFGVVPQPLLDRLDALDKESSPEPTALTSALTEAFDAIDALERSPSTVSAMGVLVDALEASRADEDLASDAVRLRDRRTAVTASAPRRAPLGSFNSRLRPSGAGVVNLRPQLVSATSREIPDRAALVAEATEQLNNAVRRPGQRLLVASARWSDQYPDDRRLTDDPFANERMFRAVAEPEAIVAAGGVCGPVDVDYTVLAMSTDDRPLATGLPSFDASRGGLRFIVSPTFAGIGDSATTIWTEAQDAATPYPNADGTLPDGTVVKPIQIVQCGEESEVLVDAIPTRLRFGNFTARFSPEWTDGFVSTVMANAARVAENYLLTQISSQSTTVSSGQLLGATRDLLATLDQIIAAFKWRNRLPDNQPITVVFPRWIINMLRADLARELAHGTDDNLDLTDAEVVSLIKSRGVDPIFTLDANDPTQNFGAQAAGMLLDWPRDLKWWMWATGTVVHLDGGRLDLSVVRDSTSNATNTYETLVESFENIAYRGGPEVLEVVSALRPNGASAGTVSTATY